MIRPCSRSVGIAAATAWNASASTRPVPSAVAAHARALFSAEMRRSANTPIAPAASSPAPNAQRSATVLQRELRHEVEAEAALDEQAGARDERREHHEDAARREHAARAAIVEQAATARARHHERCAGKGRRDVGAQLGREQREEQHRDERPREQEHVDRIGVAQPPARTQPRERERDERRPRQQTQHPELEQVGGALRMAAAAAGHAARELHLEKPVQDGRIAVHDQRVPRHADRSEEREAERHAAPRETSRARAPRRRRRARRSPRRAARSVPSRASRRRAARRPPRRARTSAASPRRGSRPAPRSRRATEKGQSRVRATARRSVPTSAAAAPPATPTSDRRNAAPRGTRRAPSRAARAARRSDRQIQSDRRACSRARPPSR